jgi:RNA polymerase sigma factor (sigma-70 family)
MEEPTDDNAWQDRVDAMLDVRAAMKSLTARERGAVVLWVCGYTPAEVAELLGVSQGTVRHIRRRALWKMKKTSA